MVGGGLGFFTETLFLPSLDAGSLQKKSKSMRNCIPTVGDQVRYDGFEF